MSNRLLFVFARLSENCWVLGQIIQEQQSPAYTPSEFGVSLEALQVYAFGTVYTCRVHYIDRSSSVFAELLFHILLHARRNITEIPHIEKVNINTISLMNCEGTHYVANKGS